MIQEIKKRLKQEEKHILGHQNMLKYAIMIPLLEKDPSMTSILFEKRAASLRRQPGEISFPGGKVEKSDPSSMAAAIRETSEELGIPKSAIEVIEDLDVYVHSHNAIIYPYIAQIHTTQFNPNPEEVGEIFTVPIDFFLETEPEEYVVQLKVEPDQSFPFHLISGGEQYRWRHGSVIERFYLYNDHVIWGMTARILYHFIQKIKTTNDIF